MDDRIQRLAAALSLDIDEETADALLKLAGDVAHATERKNAPLAAYLAGRYATGRVTAGVTPRAAIEEVRASAREFMPER